MALATVADVEIRLGRSLTEKESDSTEQIIDQLTDVIRAEFGFDVDWDLDPVPASITGVVVRKVVAIANNPTGAKSLSLGSYSESWDDTTSSDLNLTTAEIRIIRRALGISRSGSIQLR